MKRRILLSVLGGVLFFVLDSIHVRIGIWSPTQSHTIPWWYLVFYVGGIFAAANLLHFFERWYRRTSSMKLLGIDITAFVLLHALHILLFRSEELLAAVSLVVLVARLVVVRRPGDLLLGGMVAAVDVAVEWLLASRGLFAYSYAGYALLPVWLVPFWAALGMSVRGLFLVLDRDAGPVRVRL